MEKLKAKTIKTIDENKFEYPEELNPLRDEIIKNLKLCRNIIDLNTVLEEYYGEVIARKVVEEEI